MGVGGYMRGKGYNACKSVGSAVEVAVDFTRRGIHDLNKERTNIRVCTSNEKNLLLFILLPWLQNISYLKKCPPLC